MSISAITQPHTYMASYSAVPLKIYSDQWDQQELFKYIVNVVFNTVTIVSDQSINIGNDVYTLLTSSTPHLFSLGDTVLVDDSINGGQFTGYYIVQKIVSSTQFAIDLIPNSPFGGPGFTCSNVIKWKLAPDLDGYGKIDLSNTLKDFVTQNLTGQNTGYANAYDGDDTKFCYSIYCGSEQNYTFQFEDNLFVGGNVGFFNSSITSLTGIPFQIGDVITITQDVVEWAYDDNYFGAGGVGFTGSTQHSFLPGQQVTVTGQQTYPFYNGVSSILTVGTYDIVINKPWQGSTPVEPGFIYGVPRPEYNATCTITSIYVDPTYGVVIVTDMPFTTSSVAIPGIIQYADGQITENPVELKLDGFCVYNAYIPTTDYSLTAFDKYVIQTRTYQENNLSTILNSTNQYRIERNTILFPLVHSVTTTYVDGTFYRFYNNNTLLGSVYIPKPTSSDLDYYAPAGLEQILNTTYTDVTGTFTSYYNNITNYEMFACDNVAPNTYAQRTNEIKFKLNTDCSMYEIYHLMWKDSDGSFISYPFIYMSRENIEVDRRTYYKPTGTWKNDSFQYDDTDNGEKNFYVKSRKSFILNSGWLYEFERYLIEDLMQSSSVYIQTPDNRLFQCHIEATDLELYKNINEQLFSYTFNVRTSLNQYRF
jgi:hypothetical protein